LAKGLEDFFLIVFWPSLTHWVNLEVKFYAKSLTPMCMLFPMDKSQSMETIKLLRIVQKDGMMKALKHNPKSALCINPYVMNLMAFA
jgi:hypothetical protein